MLDILVSHYTGDITGSASSSINQHGPALVQICIDMYNTITTQLLPTPAKSHYTFNVRDLSKVFQGMVMVDASKITVSLATSLHTFFENSSFFPEKQPRYM